VTITREELEDLIRDDVERTVDELDATLDRAGLTADDLDAIYLAGGSSRIPLVAQLLAERFGDRVTTRDDPKVVVAMGAGRAADTQPIPPAGSAF
jgi:molecular chaperone DnaK (HSP70)